MRTKIFPLLIIATIAASFGLGYLVHASISGSQNVFVPNTFNLNVQSNQISFNAVNVLWTSNSRFVNVTNVAGGTLADSLQIQIVNPAGSNIGTNVYPLSFSTATSGQGCSGIPVSCETIANAYAITFNLSTLTPGSTIKVTV